MICLLHVIESLSKEDGNVNESVVKQWIKAVVTLDLSKVDFPLMPWRPSTLRMLEV